MTLDYPTRPQSAGHSASRARALDVLCAALRGVWAVARLLAGALAALLSAALGAPPALPTRLGHLIADEYRAGRAGAINAEVIEDTDDPDHNEPESMDREDQYVKEGRR